jgi:hypothetical protein
MTMTMSKRPRGRPPSPQGSKRDNPNYVPTTVYVERETYALARAEVVRTGQDFSDLVNELLKGRLLKARKGA